MRPDCNDDCREHHHHHWRHHRAQWRRHHHRSFGPLRRRLFRWFGLAILLTIGVVGFLVMGPLKPASNWHRSEERMRSFASDRFAAAWDRPAELGALAQSVATQFDLDVELHGADGALLATYGGACKRPYGGPVPVRRGGQLVGSVWICGVEGLLWGGSHFGARHVAGVLAAAMVLWALSGRVARRLARPLDELATAARSLGEGKLSTRADLKGSIPEEAMVLAQSFNDMAARIERQLAEQRELLAAVSHELRTPLGHMRLLIELIRDNGPSPKHLTDLEHEVLEIDALVGQLLASSRLEFAQLNRAPLQATEVAKKALQRAGAELSLLDSAAPDVRFEGDPTLLHRALANLLDNARKHGGGIQRLGVLLRDGKVVFEVDDRGKGFVPGEEAQAFDAFTRPGHDAGSLHLGLSLVKRIAEAHGGRAYAQNLPAGGARVGFEVASGAV